jgi:hypothetical protein
MSQPRLKSSSPTQSMIEEVQTSMLITNALGIAGSCMPNSITPRAPQLHVVSPAPSSLPTDYQSEFASDVVSTIKEYRINRHLRGAPNSELRFIVASATQAGKTRAMIKVCKKLKVAFVKKVDGFDEDGNREQRDEENVIVFLSFSATDVSQQTIEDFVAAGLRDEVTTYFEGKTYNNYIHPGNVNSPAATAIMKRVQEVRVNGGQIAFINDEADHSSGGARAAAGSEEYKSRLREFIRQHNIPLWDTQPPNDRKSHEVGFHVTATTAHLHELIKDVGLIPDMRVASFKLDDGYSGLDTLNELGVFEDNTKYLGRENLPALIDLCKEWIEKDQKTEDPLYHILRTQDKKTINALEKMWGSFGGVIEPYDCSGKSLNIKDLSRRFDNKPDRPTLILLKQGFSRGSRIHTVNHIANCFDAKRDNGAGVVQSLPGRMTGRRSGADPGKEQPDNRPSREFSYNKQRLKIYCDLFTISREIPAIEAQRHDAPISHEEYLRCHYQGITGTHCKETSQENRKYTNAKATAYNTKVDLIAASAALGLLKDVQGKAVPKLSVQTMSKNAKDLAAEYLIAPGRYHPAESVSNPKKAYISFYADGQGPTPASNKSWKAFPHQGKWVLVETDVTLGNAVPVLVSDHGVYRV